MGNRQTPSQTVGPYFAYGLTPEQYGYDFASIAGSAMADADTEGERIRVVGTVFDGEGAPVNDAMIELWQADAQGRYDHPADKRRSNASFHGSGGAARGPIRKTGSASIRSNPAPSATVTRRT